MTVELNVLVPLVKERIRTDMKRNLIVTYK